ncbi:ferrous iron transport protein B [Desulfuromusa kysingii]|uniref:Ferrous iron transport protein B n=1 Tax=Desulfuromusa kysingii TaxID=37625 RepID=A0A1H3VTV4_9BACT|nr:ferrous iron transport protein B [Desulfuromusa kysingii]SDZ78243.1 ferrous iron transport protein B [Desulfuromusa kysingii]
MLKVALAGQPNCGKSTIFNMLSGVNQHVANYPGVTVDKKSATLKFQGEQFEIVDLPGTYSFSTYSLEEMVAKTFLLDEGTDVIVNVVDASSLRRNLYLTFQLLELGKPLVMILNMMDIAERRELEIDIDRLSKMLNVTIVETVGTKRGGKKREILEAIAQAGKISISEPFKIDYMEFETFILEIEQMIEFDSTISKRWLAIKALEADKVILEKVNICKETIKDVTSNIHTKLDLDVDQTFARIRYDSADVVYHKCVKEKKQNLDTLTAKIDRVVLNKWLAFPVLGLVIYLIYQLSIVWGYKLTNYTWPLLAALKNGIVALLPPPELTNVPIITDFSIWMVNSAIALLNYIPIFFILFALIAVLEDVGYMPRMAFILDRVFRKFGLHGQSTLPLVLGGAFVGGCAVPGVMATKGIADDRARLATILTVPYMNCLAKVPFYTLLLGAFFKEQMALMMFFISTVTLFIALIIAKLATSTVLKNRETAPFIMELPTYHLPTLSGVLFRASQRVWLYVKKVMTIVLAVAVVLFVLLQYPGVSDEKMTDFSQQMDSALEKFDKTVKDNLHYQHVDQIAEVSNLVNLYDNYKNQRMLTKTKSAVASLDAEFLAKNPELFPLVRPQDKDAREVSKAARRLSKTNKRLQIAIKNEKITNSFLGMFGRALEPVTQYAGFDWRINVAFLSSFAARESAVATLGSIYEKGKSNLSAEESLAQDGAYTPIHAAAMLLFMILTPPCIATMVVVKLQTNSYRWMLFAIFFPTTLGVVLSILFFSMAVQFSWSGLELMRNFYLSAATLALILSLFKTKQSGWQVGKSQ